MANNHDQLYLSPPSFPDKHKDSFAKDRDALLTEVRDMRAAIERMRISGHYSAKGLTAEIGARLAATSKVLVEFKAKTVGRIDQHVAEETAVALKPKESTEDQQLRFARLLAKRELLAREDPTQLWLRLKQAVDNGGGAELIDALQLLAPEFPVGDQNLIEQTKLAIAERDNPSLGEYAQLRSAYNFIIGTAVQEMTQLAQAHGVSPQLASDATPYLVGSGEPVPAAK